MHATGIAFNRRRRGAILVSLLALCATPVGADQTDDFFLLTKTYFAKENMVPITVPRGEQAGDVYDARNNSLLARRAECFPNISQPSTASSNLPHIESKSSLNVGAALSLPVIVSVGGKNVSARHAEVDFDEVNVASVSVVGLRKSADYDACPFLKAVLQGAPQGQPGSDEIPVIMSEVLSAKRVVQLTFDDHATASASIIELQKLIPKLGLSGSAEFDAQDDKKVWVRSQEILPIAYRPVYSRAIAERLADSQEAKQAPSSGQLVQTLVNRVLGTAPAPAQ